MEAAMQNCAAAADAVSTVITSPLFSDDAPQINSIHVSLSSPDTSCYHNNHAVWFKAYSFCILYFLNNTRDPDSFSAIKIHCYNQKRVKTFDQGIETIQNQVCYSGSFDWSILESDKN